MTDSQEVKRDAAQGIVDLLSDTDNATALAGVTQIATDLAKLIAILSKISELEGKIGADNTGAAADKTAKREALEKIGLKVSKACVAFYHNAHNNSGVRKTRYTKTTLKNFRDGILHSRMENLFSIADPIKTSLVAFNSGGTDTALLNSTTGEFQSLIQNPTDLKKDREEYVAEQVVNFHTMDGILNDLDIWVDTFEETEPTIWGLYKTRRSLYNTAAIGHTLLSTEETVAAGTKRNINMDGFTMEDDYTIDVNNTGTVVLKAGFGPDANTLGGGFSINTGAHLKHTAIEWGYSNVNTFFNVMNATGTDAIAKVKVRDR